MKATSFSSSISANLSNSGEAMVVFGQAMKKGTSRSKAEDLVHVENVVSLFSSPSTSSQKVRKCGSHKFLSSVASWSLLHCLTEYL